METPTLPNDTAISNDSGHPNDTGHPTDTALPRDTARSRPEVLVDSRPWGSFRQYAHNEAVTVKIITVAGGESLSRQRHEHRDELWIALDEGLVVELDGVLTRPGPGEETWIPRGSVHRASASTGCTRFVEVAFGHFDEDDIERLDDIYGR